MSKKSIDNVQIERALPPDDETEGYTIYQNGIHGAKYITSSGAQSSSFSGPPSDVQGLSRAGTKESTYI